MIQMHLQDMRLNMVGDAEKVFLDTCLRDFEGVSTLDPRYRSKRRKCVQEFHDSPRHHWLPMVRQLVDQGVCDPGDLCDSGDPGQCADEVAACYALVDSSRHPSKTVAEAASLESQFVETCRRAGRWDGYEHEVQLEYCMWKHMSAAGICTNTVRTTCPEDDSCCPLPQSYVDEAGESVPSGPRVFHCQRSPVLGIFCQHSDYAAPPPGSGPCTQMSCPGSFQWCTDLADLSGQCLGTPCQEYHRSLAYAALLVASAALGLLLDLADAAAWACRPRAALPKAAAGFLAAAAKLTGLALLLASGIGDLVDAVVAKGCFNPAGARMLDEDLRGLLAAFGLACGSAGAASLAAAPLSALWVGHFSELPYARRSLSA
ncbi:unnamed protein product [Prorocentrum cordatum]|uniref:CASP-like protein n=1 Tax=Prorocentrum cordatum TaxID=2364126 RepID=A0ABN9T2S5_9DINO|nr:unnamed protein product [Polarella glacialis]